MGNIEQRGKNSWRVGVQFKDLPGRPWVRRPLKFPDTMTDDEQRAAAEAELVKLEADVAAGLAAPHSVTAEAPEAQHASPIPSSPSVLSSDTMPAPDCERRTIKDLAELWLTNHVDSDLEPTTARTYKNIMNARILPLIGHLYPEDLTPFTLARITAQLRKSPRISHLMPECQRKTPTRPSDIKKRSKNPDKPLSDRTVRHCVDVLGYMLGKCKEWQLIPINPLNDIEKPKAKKHKMKWLDDTQAVDLLRKIGHDPRMNFRVSVFLALVSGLRLGEVGGLFFGDVNYKKGYIDIQRALKYAPGPGNYFGSPKSEAGERIVTLPPAMLTMLHETELDYQEIAASIGDRWRGDGRIVCGWDGSPLHHDTLSKWFSDFAKANGYPGVTFHKLRHTHASILFANNMDAISVAYRLGHSDPATTFRNYGHAMRARDKQSADTMQALMERVDHEDPTPES